MRWEGDKGGRAPCASTWTAEKDAALRRLWPDRDLSCPQIAVEIGGGATKNSVIGRARRLKLGPKPRSSEAKQRGQADGAATKRARSERERVVSGQALAERRERQAAAGREAIAKVDLTLINNRVFVAKAEKPPDLYAHLRTERGYHDAIAALSR